jgi:hypothetical protein
VADELAPIVVPGPLPGSSRFRKADLVDVSQGLLRQVGRADAAG